MKLALFALRLAATILAMVVLAWRPNDLTAQGPIRGFVDLHSHQFANLAFGGQMVTGAPYGPIEQSLTTDSDRHHSANHSFDILGGILAGHPWAAFYGNAGYPAFDWPRFFEVSHQKVHQDWLYRAVQGGLRLMVMYAVESEVLCNSIGHGEAICANVKESILAQLHAAYAMQDYVDAQAGGAGLGWYRIVTTAGEARRVMEQGKLAVVLGVETSYPFDCRASDCAWRQPFEELWQLGVRAFFPVHHGLNGFGSPSFFRAPLQIPSDRAEEVALANAVALMVLMPQGGFPYLLPTNPCDYKSRSCSASGLTRTGKALVREVMERGGIIDVDHMSDAAFGDTLSMAEQLSYPVVASHAGFNAVNRRDQDHEGQLTSVELMRIRNVGGMIGLITAQGQEREHVADYARPGRYTIPHVCGGSTETFAQALLYALDAGGGITMGLGSDFNGPLRQVGPRFGAHQCDGGVDTARPKNATRLSYPFVAATGVRMEKPVSGNRTFDFNIDGLAHVGLLPDMLADLRVLGIPASDLEPLFTSAEGYVRMWERAERVSASTLKNIGFESGSLARWAKYSPEPGFAARAVAGAGRSGTFGLSEAGSLGIVYQDVVGLRPATTYRIAAWVKAAPGTAVAKAELSVHNTQEGGFRAVSRDVAGTWGELALLFTTDSLERLRVHLVKPQSGGSLLWDDVSVSEVPLNGGFEHAVTAPWQLSAATADSIRVDTVHNSGNFGLAMDAGTVSQDVSGLTPGRSYLISAWVNLPDAASGAAELSVHDGAGTNWAGQSVPSGGAGWRRLRLLYLANSTGRIRIHLTKLPGAGTIHWDDVEVAEASSISGRVTHSNGSTAAGVEIGLSGWQQARATTAADGRYSFPGLEPDGYYTVAPVRAELGLAPCQRQYSPLLGGDRAADFRVSAGPRHSIAGRISKADGRGLDGVVVNLAGGCTRSTTTDTAGAFRFADLLPGGTYTVAPVGSLIYDYTPSARNYRELVTDHSDATFVAIPEERSISGRVTVRTGEPLPRVTLTLAGSATQSVATDDAGKFRFTALAADGSYTITPAAPGYAFTPQSASFSLLSRDRTGVGFRATLIGYRAAGRALNVDGSAIPDLELSLTGPTNATVRTDRNGAFVFERLLPGGRYRLTPCTQQAGEVCVGGSGDSYAFTPGLIDLGPVQSDIAGLVVRGTTARHRVAGTVRSVDDQGMRGVVVKLDGPTTGHVVTTSSGGFQFEGLLPGGRYSLAVLRCATSAIVGCSRDWDLHTFIPMPIGLGTVSSDRYGLVITGSKWIVSGTVLDAGVRPMTAAMVTVKRRTGTFTETVPVNPLGGFRVLLPGSGTYEVTVAHEGFDCGSPIRIEVTTTTPAATTLLRCIAK
jgi:microsomal dipeptidase-like Zn-dependent dipeptidase